MKKSMTFILALILSLSLFQLQPHVRANTETEQVQTYTYNNGGSYLDKATVPQGQVVIGTNGQIRPLQDSIIKDTQYAFSYQVSNPTILSVDEKGNWQALKSGTTTITIYPTSRGTSPNFEAELDALGIQRAPAEPGIAYPAQTFAVTVSDNSLIPVSRLYHPGLRVHLYTKDVNEYNVLANRGWRQEGMVYRSSDTKAIYRLYHKGIKKHLYSSDVNEKNVLSNRGWRYEGIAWYVE